MHQELEAVKSLRKGVSLTIRQDVMKAAKDLGLNVSKAAEAGILKAVKEMQASEWLETNEQALEAHNNRVAKTGTLLKPDWAK